jgi:predicted DsbA family dithiol-disulfide isomerase
VRTERLQQEYGIELKWTVFPLHPETPEEGTELAELFAGREEQIKAMQVRLRRLAADMGLPMAERTRTYNSRRAQELGKWAEAQGKGDPFRHSVYQAFFVEGRNIARVDELVRIAEAIGLSGNEARGVITSGSFAAAVDADWRRAGELGITAVPTHLCAGKSLVGFGAYEDFVHLIGKS